ncbi:response regulator (CheY-like receiver domain and AraC-type DNA-binding domain-containing protein) [Lachnospiraceae bacterium JC7]|nr:response regulator (CheY-like receiver domain and AraC-type DNA-binding domain-containing protein) [Lachnospiraceae bacterium JC7]
MIRIMIADDEKYEREYLTKFIAENYANVLELVFSAKDGAELLDKAFELRPEIILMDIRMPRLDGLEAAEKLRRKLPKTELVILSAYGQFSYAKQAMKLGVRDFLVKPYLDEELMETLNRIMAGMDVSDDTEINEQTRNMEILYGDADRDMVWPLAFQMRGSRMLKNELNLFGVSSGNYKCVAFYHESIQRIGSAGCEVIRSFFRQSSDHVLVSSIFSQLVIFIFSDDEMAYSELNAAIRKTREYLSDLSSEPILCGSSGSYSSVEDAGRSFREAESYIEDYAVPELKDTFRNELTDIEELCEAEERLYFHILSRNHDKTDKYRGILMDVLRRHETEENMLRRDLWHLMMSLIRKLNHHSEKRIPTDVALRIKEMFCDKNTVSSSGEGVECIFAEAVSILEDTGSDSSFTGNALIVRKAKAYMKKHYSEQIGLQSVADELKVSSGYLSKSFKAQEGSSFTEYLTEIRIARSMELIRETGRSITEISYEVGFQDPGYFGKCFKKSENMSPSEYAALVKM